MTEMSPSGGGRVRIEYTVPTRGLIGYRSEFLTATRGTGILNATFREYGEFAGTMKQRLAGVLISSEAGETNAYGLFSLQERGALFLGAQVKVYAGQIVGEHSRENDLVVNPNKKKALNNIRTTAADEKLTLVPPRLMSLEEALEFINPDELVEVTPKAIRLRKRILDHNLRKANEKKTSTGQFAGEAEA
jgi:GTP-binding protein